MSGEKEQLLSWYFSTDEVTPVDMGRWHIGKEYNRLPTKKELQDNGLMAIAKGWLPQQPIIGPDTRVLAVGSCFARNFTLWLAEHGFNRSFPDSPYNALLRFGAHFESPAAIAQQFRWAFDELDPSSLLWIDQNRHLIKATDEGKRQVRQTLEQTDVLVITLGLSEVWYDKLSGEPLWRTLTAKTFDPERHVFRVESMAQTLHWLQSIERLRAKHLPNLKIVYTLSPIPLKTTFRPVSAISANSVSKAVIRAALDEFMREHADKLNQQLFYFPSYEIVTSYFIDPFIEDNRHLAAIVPGTIIAFFAEHFCEPAVRQSNADNRQENPDWAVHERVLRHAAAGAQGAQSRELLARIAELEEQTEYLQKVCDERLVVIEGLDKAAKERLALVEALHQKLNGGNQLPA